MLTVDQKNKIVAEINHRSSQYTSASKQAIAYDINASQLSRIKKGDIDNVISNAKWMSIARRLDVELTNKPNWKTAKTIVFEYIYNQLVACQTNSVSAILCDIADIGKTHTSRYYCAKNQNAVYIDCSQFKTKQKLIKAIAKEFGVEYTGKYRDVYEDLVFYLNYINKPLVVLDEAGDLDYGAFLELKALWNATENKCAWYMMGADGLQVKINKNKERKKVGYTEIFSRFGSKFQKVTPEGKEDLQQFKYNQVATIAKANDSKVTSTKMYAKTNGSLRRIKTEIQKQSVA